MDKLKVSIIIPVYNGSNYMREAIDSAINQTYKNIEIIVINDGSNDETDEIAKSYGNKIRYYKKENGGVSTALNLGLEKMTGDYFSWLSHDDLYLPDKIEKEVGYLYENGNPKNIILFSDYYLINEQGNVISECIKKHDEISNKPEYALLRGHVNGNSLLIPREAFEKYGNFDEKLRCVQDYLLWFKMMKTYTYVHIPEMLVKSRVHNKQVTETNPNVLKEGNWFWTKMISEIRLEDRIRLEGSNYNFLIKMADFLKTTPYEDTRKYCLAEATKEEKVVKKIYKNVKVSVIIPFLNRADLVVRAIDSVLNQTYDNIELILINDGSTEDISKVIKIIKKTSGIKFIDLKQNAGAANARNLGIKAASGDYIAFLDSDDEFIKDKIDTQVYQMVLNGSVFSYTQYLKRNGNKEELMCTEIINGNPLPKLIYSCGIATPTVMIKKSYLINNNYYYDPKLVIGEDTCFWLSMLKNNEVLGIEKPLTIVNTDDNSAVHNYQKQLTGYKTIINYLLNDPFYQKFDYEIAILMQTYVECVRSHTKVAANQLNYLKKESILKRLIRCLKTYGIKITIKKIFKKIVRKLKRS